MYDTVHYDPGNNFNMITSEYRAPMTGQYLVASHLMSGGNEAHQKIQVNGVLLLSDHMYDDVTLVTGKPTVVLRLNAGDILSIQHAFGTPGGDIRGLVVGQMQTWLSVALLHTE